jgi:predicted transcriptional regulator
MALLFGLIGLLYNPLLIFVALFVWMGAIQEATMVKLKSAIGGIPVEQAMVSEFKTLALHDSLRRASELTLAGSQKDFPVVSDGILEGVLRQTDLLTALTRKDAKATVASILRKDTSTIESTEMLDTVITKLSECRCELLPVTREGKLVGVVTTDNLGAFIRLREVVAN